jgi:serine/threonine-protein kinase
LSGPLVAGQIIAGRYTIDQYIGEGGMQYVYAATDNLLTRRVAIKTPKNNSAKKRFERSAVVAARVNHPNVAKTLDYIDEENRQFLVEELVEGPNLDAGLLRRAEAVDPYMTACILHHLARGVAASHHAGVVHRDLKPSNVVFLGVAGFDVVKITDFGIAKMAETEIADAIEGGIETISSSSTAFGALPYMAPECIENPSSVGMPADIWALGALAFELLTGSKPFGAGFKAVQQILTASFPPVPTFVISNAQFSPLAEQLLSLIRACLQKDPTLRPTADQLVTKCGDLFYPVAKRLEGTVTSIMYDAWGFISFGNQSAFFHLHSVYGRKPKRADKVMFCVFPGTPHVRAHPVVVLPGT